MVTFFPLTSFFVMSTLTLTRRYFPYCTPESATSTSITDPSFDPIAYAVSLVLHSTRNCTRNRLSSSSLMLTPLLGFHSILRFFLRASTWTLLWVRIFSTTHNLPLVLAAMVLLFPNTMPLSSSSVKDSFLHNSSNSSAITSYFCLHWLTHPPLQMNKTCSVRKREKQSVQHKNY